jgi:hypothetical protein
MLSLWEAADDTPWVFETFITGFLAFFCFTEFKFSSKFELFYEGTLFLSS